jgi:transaldolase
MPPKIIDQISKFGKSFAELSIDTVKGFLTDSKKSKFKI